MVLAEQLLLSEPAEVVMHGVAEHARYVGEFDMKFILPLAFALFLVLLTFIWFACRSICSRRTSSTEGPDLHELQTSLDAAVAERDSIQAFCNVLKDDLATVNRQRQRDVQIMCRNTSELDHLRETTKDLRLTVGSLRKQLANSNLEIQAARAAAVANVFICPRGRVWHKWRECPMISGDHVTAVEDELCMRCAQTLSPPVSNVRWPFHPAFGGTYICSTCSRGGFRDLAVKSFEPRLRCGSFIPSLELSIGLWNFVCSLESWRYIYKYYIYI